MKLQTETVIHISTTDGTSSDTVVAAARQWDTQLLNLSYPEILPSTPREFSCQIASQNRRVPLWHETQA
jgi:hypothetical protein